MEGEKIELSQGQLQRFRVMGLVEVGRITLREAAGKLGLSYRQAPGHSERNYIPAIRRTLLPLRESSVFFPFKLKHLLSLRSEMGRPF